MYSVTCVSGISVKSRSCHHGVAHPHVEDGRTASKMGGGGVVANILIKKSRTADKEWSSSLGVGRGADNSSP